MSTAVQRAIPHLHHAVSVQAAERDQGAALLAATVAQCSRVRFVSSLLAWGSAVVAALKANPGEGRRALWPALAAILDRCSFATAPGTVASCGKCTLRLPGAYKVTKTSAPAQGRCDPRRSRRAPRRLRARGEAPSRHHAPADR